MNFTMPIFSLAIPEMFLLGMTCLILLVDVFIKENHRKVTYFLVQLTLFVTLVVVAWQYRFYPSPVVTFSGNYILDKLALLVKMFALGMGIFSFVYADDYLRGRNVSSSEFYILGLFAVLGMLVMASAYTFLTIYLGLELLSLSLYAMIALNKEVSASIEAAMKYFVLGALASGILLYGISMVFGATNTLDIAGVSKVFATLSSSQTMMLVLGLIFIIAGLMFKFGSVPFHMWVPDVYEGAIAPVTLFIASAPKIAAFAITIRILVEAMPMLHVEWTHVLVAISLLSMFFGNVLAIAQTNVKRMLAYSSIAHIGYMLLGILAGPGSKEGYSAAMFYITTYAIVAAGAFAVIGLLSRQGVELDQLDDYRGLNARNPWIAFMMLLLMFSMAGVPPTVGFFAKLGLLEALVEAHFVWLAALALLFAIIGAYYYLRIVMLMYFEEPRTDARISIGSSIALAAISVNGVAALILGLLPSTLIDMCRISLS